MEEENKESKIIGFFKSNMNLVLIAILLLAIFLRLKYLNINSAIWWDEGEYLSMAKEWAYGINYFVPPARQPLIPFLISIFYRLGIESLSVIKFFVISIPSIASVFLTYLLGKELYNKKVGLISSFMMAVFWIPLFWSTRTSTDLMGLFFSLLAFWAFWKGYTKKEKPALYLAISGISLALGFATRVGNILAVLIIGVFLLTIARLDLLKNKSLRFLMISSIIALIPYLIYNYVKFGSIFAFWGLYFGTVSYVTKESIPFFWGFFSFFRLYLFNLFFIIFLIGLIDFYKLFLGFDVMLKKLEEKLLADFFTLLMIVIPTIYFAFIQRQTSTEPRWAMIMAPAIFFVTAKGFLFLYEQIVKYLPTFNYKKIVSIAIIIIFIILASVQQLKYADALIEIKKDTYIQLKFAGEWIKENSNEDDIIFSSAVPQNSYYSERKTITVHGPEEKFNRDIAELKPKFLMLTSLEGYPDWAWDWPQRHQDLVIPVQAYFIDPEKTKPILILYAFIDYPDQESNTVADVNASIEKR